MSRYVGLVLVSHSVDLVYGLQKLISQIEPEVPVAIAGGAEDNEIGTSAIKIKAAVETVRSEKGAILLFDLGSACMNAELALEWLGDQRQVKIADAPLVEGAYAAVIESGCGGSLDEVWQAAQAARCQEKMI
ncbi:dihydroxyacetone kinase [Cohnella kolymensis]|uniref:phosphoenolpyruvate--glycerone phosphotransferase n=1 Tax=Cohnella kolymensis TaxID=1590652 RepID=A0ABR5A9H1_9BACL|nr:dihydroxyacetone kinase phosphoryl donor subunit DhaM [Cohnella kolymensis]KIL37639.1 dihydroxyacetone kinase [Cohnella kolymensis]